MIKSKNKYVDGFVLVVPTKNLSAYQKISKKAGKIWREHGALEYLECSGDDLKADMGVSYTKLLNLKKGETAVFSWIAYKSKAQRDKVNALVMKDPRLAKMMEDPTSMPFDLKRMAFGGFKVLVSE